MNNKQSKGATVSQYRKLFEQENKGQFAIKESQKAEIREYLHIFAEISVDVQVFVEDDEDIKVYEGDICTIRVTISRKQLEEGERVGYVHCPHFSFPKRESFWVLLGQANTGKVFVDRAGRESKQDCAARSKIGAPPVGHYEFDSFVKFNGYVGVDQKLSLVLDTLDNLVLPTYEIHPDDADLDIQPTLFEAILQSRVEEDSDNENKLPSAWVGTRSDSARKRV